MAKELDPVQTAYQRWMVAMQLYREELSKPLNGGKSDAEKVKALSEEAKARNEEFLAALNKSKRR